MPDSTPPVKRFVKRVASVTAAFFIVSSFSLFDYYFQSPVQGYEAGYPELGVEDFTNQDISTIISTINEEDGAFLSPNLTANKQSDRSTSNEVIKYHVEAGDTVASIAEHYGISQQTLMTANNFYDVNQLKEGMDINVLGVDGITYVVQEGDSLGKIAEKNNIKIEDIVRQNQLEEGEPITPNMNLILPGVVRVVEKPQPKPTYVAKNGGSRSTGNSGGGASGYTAPDYTYSGSLSPGSFIHPAPNGCIVTQRYHGGHYAIDCANRSKGPIVASLPGTVVKANDSGYGGGYGLHTIVRSDDGTEVLYAHFSEIHVKVGDVVEQGHNLGEMGSTGFSTGNHLHIEVRDPEGRKINPGSVINF